MRTVLHSPSFCKDDAGSSLIETAVAYLMMMMCVLGVIEGSLTVYTYAVYADAARHGVRYAMIHGSDSSNCSGPTTGCGDPEANNVVNVVTSYAQIYTAPVSGAKVSVSYPDSGGCTPPSRVIVTIKYSYYFLFRYPSLALNFQATSQARILY